MKKLILGTTAIFFMMSVVSGCANKVHTYANSNANVIALKDISVNYSNINVGEFTDSDRDETSVMCRLAAPVGTPEGETFASYIQNALISELIAADMYDGKSETLVSANLDNLYGSTVVGNAYWEFDLTITSNNGSSYSVSTTYDYDSSYLASSACSEMQRSFVPAVQKVIADIITHPQFINL
jgi:hypothetical protein